MLIRFARRNLFRGSSSSENLSKYVFVHSSREHAAKLHKILQTAITFGKKFAKVM